MSASSPIAVVDVGSNSGRVVVAALRGTHLQIMAEAHAPLRLSDEIRDGRLTAAGFDRTVAALRDFKAVADRAGAASIVVAATSAVRESSNAADLARAIKEETGLALRVLDGEEEARYAFAGAVRSLDVRDGALIDLGGGSAEVTLFHSRKAERSWTLPLGALRVSRAYFASDVPAAREVRALRDHVLDLLAAEGIDRPARGAIVVATGGTARTLARVDRHERSYPIQRIHGYELTRDAVAGIVARLLSASAAKRGAMRGVNSDRADSIAGGGLVLQTLADALGADKIIVSGQGLREGIAAEELGIPMPNPNDARRDSIRAVASRFATWKEDTARRRGTIAAQVATAIGGLDAEHLEMLGHAATIADAGRAIDPYNHERHAALISLGADLSCFTHRQLAIIAAHLFRLDDSKTGLRSLRVLLQPEDRDVVATAGVALAIADALVERIDPASPVECDRDGRTLLLRASCPPGRWSRDVADLLRHHAGLSLHFEEARP